MQLVSSRAGLQTQAAWATACALNHYTAIATDILPLDPVGVVLPSCLIRDESCVWAAALEVALLFSFVSGCDAGSAGSHNLIPARHEMQPVNWARHVPCGRVQVHSCVCARAHLYM